MMGVKKTIAKRKKTNVKKDVKKDLKGRANDEFDDAAALLKKILEQSSILDTTRKLIFDTLGSSSKGPLTDELVKFTVPQLLEMHDNMQKNSNSDWKVHILAQNIYSKQLDQIDELAENITELKSVYSTLVDHLALKEVGTRDDKRNVAMIVDAVKNAIEKKSSGDDSMSDVTGVQNALQSKFK